MRNFLAIGALAVLAACGGGGASEPAAAAPTPEPAPVVQKTVRVMQYGDSTTAGWFIDTDGIGKRMSPTPAQQLQALLQAKYGDGVTVRESSRNGQSLRYLISGTQGGKSLSEALSDDPSQIVTLRYGLNDKSQYGPAEFKGYLVTAVQLMQAAGKRVVIQEPNPTTDNTAEPYARVAAQVAMEFGLPLVANYSLPAWSTPLSDGVHPSREQYLATVPAQVPVLSPIIEALL